jgi:hypothetical protein
LTDPPLTRAEKEVIEVIAEGWSYRRIAEWLGICESTVHTHVGHIASKLPNPDDIKPYHLVFLWSAHRKWLLDRQARGTDAA